jgi:hypothetical protein
VIVLSTYEKEYIAATLSACQAIWLGNLINEIGVEESEAVTKRID